MAARNSPSKGSKPDKIMRDAIMLALHEEAIDADGQMTTKARLLGRKLVDRALDGDVPAIKEVNDRADGKVPQAIVGDDNEAPVNLKLQIERTIVDPKAETSSGAGVPSAPGASEV